MINFLILYEFLSSLAIIQWNVNFYFFFFLSQVMVTNYDNFDILMWRNIWPEIMSSEQTFKHIYLFTIVSIKLEKGKMKKCRQQQFFEDAFFCCIKNVSFFSRHKHVCQYKTWRKQLSLFMFSFELNFIFLIFFFCISYFLWVQIWGTTFSFRFSLFLHNKWKNFILYFLNFKFNNFNYLFEYECLMGFM